MLAVALLLASAPAAAQVSAASEPEPAGGPGLRLTGTAGLSIREGPGQFRFGQDVRSAALRLQLALRERPHPWVEAGVHERPDLDCDGVGVPCSETGATLRAGVSLPLISAADTDRPGLQGELLGGIGAGFGAETELGYVLGLELQWRQWPPVLPVLGVRWERFPHLSNVLMATLGLRLDIL